MYKNIEDFYKKIVFIKKIKIWTFLLAFIITPFLLVVSTSKHYFILLIIILIVTILIMKRIYEKILNEKLYFTFSNKEIKENSLDSIISEKEKMILIQYLKDNNLYIKDSINCILNHYRCFIKKCCKWKFFSNSIYSIFNSISFYKQRRF